MRYAVTGAAGFIGSHLTCELLVRGHSVAGFDSFTDYYDPAIKRRNAAEIEMHEVDLASGDLDFRGFDGIFHLAGQPGVRSFGDVFSDYLTRNVLATQRVFEAAASAGIRVALASSSSVYGEAEAYPTPESTLPRPRSPYGVTKLACEHLADAYREGFGLDCVVLRYFTVYGPRQRPDMAFTRLVTALARDEVFELYGDGAQSRGFTYVDDAVGGTISAFEHGTGTYNIGGGEEATVLHAIELLEELSGRSLRVRRQAAAKGDVRRTSADITRARADLGWRPETPLEIGLAAQWSWALHG